ncbi:MAG TPA: hypothetical protein VL463_09450 [Kofleriaceae bacterium]|nr:hypothetical protein [Kofleriaceae bacterium]
MRSIVLVLIVVGCGTDPVPIGEYNAQLAWAACVRGVRCGTYDSIERCLRAPPAQGPITPSIEAAVAMGLVDYDAEQAAQCIDERAAISCAYGDTSYRLADDSVVCRGVVRAGRKVGDVCEIDAECASRRCVRPCDVNFTCDPETCTEGQCVTPAPESGWGQDCTPGFNKCAPSAWCSDVNQCLPHLPLGTPCTRAEQCDFELDCLEVCRPALHEGDACLTLGGEPSCGAVESLFCDEGTMTCRKALGAGEPCDLFDNHCAAGWLACDQATRKCVPFARIGEQCTLPLGLCEAGAFCARSGEADPGVCLPLVDDGSPCTFDFDCASAHCNLETHLCAPPITCF